MEGEIPERALSQVNTMHSSGKKVEPELGPAVKGTKK